MECRDAEARLSEYIDGFLAADEAALLEAHLGECLECNGTYVAMTRLIGQMREVGDVDEPADLLENVKARLQKKEPPAEAWRRMFRRPAFRIPLQAAAVALLVCLIVFRPWKENGLVEKQITLTIAPEAIESMLANVEKRGGKRSGPRGKKGPVSLGDIVSSAGGEVVDIEHGGEGGQVSVLVVNIPRKNQDSFLQQLQVLGHITLDTPDTGSAGEDGMVLFRIRVNRR